MEGQIQFFQPITTPASIFVTAQGGTTFGTRDTGRFHNSFWAASSPRAYGTNELFGNQYIFPLGYLHDLFTLPPFLGKKIYVIGSYEFAKCTDFRSRAAFQMDINAGVLAETASDLS